MIDEITDHFEAFFVDAEEDGALPPAMLNACQLGLQTVNKYYSLMDESILYCLAILLHPSMRKAYFVMENWEEEWIDTAVYLLENLWQRHYQSKVWTAAVSLAASASAKPVWGILARLASSQAAGGDANHILTFTNGAPIFPDGLRADPISYWLTERARGNH